MGHRQRSSDSARSDRQTDRHTSTGTCTENDRKIYMQTNVKNADGLSRKVICRPTASVNPLPPTVVTGVQL